MSQENVPGHSFLYFRSGDKIYGFRFLGNLDLKKAQLHLNCKDPLEFTRDVKDENNITWCVDYHLHSFYPDAIPLPLEIAW